MLATVLLTMWLSVMILGLRASLRNFGSLRAAWKAARHWERVAMLLVFVPIPGPIDEIIAGIVLARVLRRIDNVERV